MKKYHTNPFLKSLSYSLLLLSFSPCASLYADSTGINMCFNDDDDDCDDGG